MSRDFPCLFTHHNFANRLRDKINEAVYRNRILRGSPEMPSGELVGTTLKLTTGREVTDGHSHFPTLKGDTGVHTRIICGYNPCRSNRQNNSTSYAQQRRHQIWHSQDHITCPRVKFREDLGKLLKEWRTQEPGWSSALTPTRIFTRKH